MTTSLQQFEATLHMPKRFTIGDNDESRVTLILDPMSYPGRRGVVIRRWSTEDKLVQMAYAVQYGPENRLARTVCIVGRQGIVALDVGRALAALFMPDDTVVIEWEMIVPGWPPGLVINDKLSLVEPGTRRPGLD